MEPMNPYRLGGMLLAAAALLSTMLAGAAQASADTNTDYPWSRLTLAVKAPHGVAHVVRLECQPSGGTHPHANNACRDVSLARGNFDRLPGDPQMIACTMEFRPMIASARGMWHGKRVHWQHQYPNPCVLVSKAGKVFDF